MRRLAMMLIGLVWLTLSLWAETEVQQYTAIIIGNTWIAVGMMK